MIRDSWKLAATALAAAALMAGCATAPQATSPTAKPSGSGPYSTQNVPEKSKYPDARTFHVTYAFTVSPDGRVLQPRVVESDSPALMVLATRQALMSSTFSPCDSSERSCDFRHTYRFFIPFVEIHAHNP
ncbi:MAG TPA: energy transducer TonB [Gammaproteobacteria bacterium]|jgi:hypothetical protein|nr:energy transducer TonB [Gammaproteobacteria bacterium]